MKAIDDTIYQAYLTALLNGDRLQCATIVEQAREANIPIKDIYEALFQRALYEIGELWEYNKISVAIEHMATSITEGLMNQLYAETISPKRVGKKVVISSVEKELHQVGGKMVADTFEMNGWDSFYLGSNTPTHELLSLIRQIKPDVAGLSLNLLYNLKNLEKTIRVIQTEFEQLPILIGGQALRFGIASNIIENYPMVIYISSLDDLEHFIKSM